MKSRLPYKDAGVDTVKAQNILSQFSSYLKDRPKDPSLLLGIGPFASCYSLGAVTSQYKNPVLVTCCDGVGTKLKLALDWGAIDRIGTDLVAMNVNDLLCMGAVPALFLDYYACGALREDDLTTILKDIQSACERSGCTLAGGETAEMPGLYRDRDFDLAGFAAGFVDEENILGKHRVEEGDLIFAIESSGFHSNGYSLLRSIIDRESLSPESVSPFNGKTWKEIFLTPTTLYVSCLQPHLKSIHGLVHVTGGGLYENLPRVIGEGFRAVLSSKEWTIPEPFLWVEERAELSRDELLSTFNCGVGMIVILPSETVNQICDGLLSHGIRTFKIGRIESSDSSSSKIVWE